MVHPTLLDDFFKIQACHWTVAWMCLQLAFNCYSVHALLEWSGCVDHRSNQPGGWGLHCHSCWGWEVVWGGEGGGGVRGFIIFVTLCLPFLPPDFNLSKIVSPPVAAVSTTTSTLTGINPMWLVSSAVQCCAVLCTYPPPLLQKMPSEHAAKRADCSQKMAASRRAATRVAVSSGFEPDC